MSEMSKAFTVAKKRLFDFSGTMEELKKEYFREGWEAREVLANKRVAEIEKAATMAERKRCALICDRNGLNSSSPSNFADACANEIRRG